MGFIITTEYEETNSGAVAEGMYVNIRNFSVEWIDVQEVVEEKKETVRKYYVNSLASIHISQGKRRLP